MNELLLFLAVVIDFAFILACFRRRQNLMVVMVVNLLLISVFGSKLTSFFGFTTNVGNVFYAAVFFATHLVLQHYGKDQAMKNIWVGFAAVTFFLLMGQIVLGYTTIESSREVSNAMQAIFKFVPQITIASLVAYIFSQYVNVYLFESIRRKLGEGSLWVRSSLAMLGGQLVDSVVFFSLAFWGILSFPVILEMMVIGCALKVLIGIIALPLLDLSRVLVPKS